MDSTELPQITLNEADRRLVANLPLHSDYLDCVLDFIYRYTHNRKFYFMESLPVQLRLVLDLPTVNLQQVIAWLHAALLLFPPPNDNDEPINSCIKSFWSADWCRPADHISLELFCGCVTYMSCDPQAAKHADNELEASLFLSRCSLTFKQRLPQVVFAAHLEHAIMS